MMQIKEIMLVIMIVLMVMSQFVLIDLMKRCIFFFACVLLRMSVVDVETNLFALDVVRVWVHFWVWDRCRCFE